MKRFLFIFFALVAVPVFAEEIVDRIVAQVGNEPVLETELFQAALLEAQNVGIDILMTGDARICAHIQTAKIAHSGRDTHCVGPIGASVSA